MPRTNFFAKAIAIIAFVFSLASCMEKIGDERFESQTFVMGDYLLTPEVKIEIETIKTVVHDTLYYKVVVMDSIFIHDTLPPRYVYDTVEVEVPVPYPVHDTVIVVKRDTVWQTKIEERIDTLYLRDTIDKSFSGMLRGKCYVAGRKKAAVQQYILDKGEIVNQEVLYGTFHFSLSSGKTEVKKEAVLNSKYPNISGNMFSFDVTDGVGGANVSNTWGYEYNAVAQFDGFTETIDAELSIETADFYQRSNLEWRHMVTASLDGIPQASATWEFWKEVVPEPEVVRDTTYSSAVPVSATQAKTVRTITANGKQVSSKDILVPYAVKFECGEKEMISNMSLLDYGKAVAAKTGVNTVAMNIHEFPATVEVPSTLTFEDEGKQITVDFVYANLAIESNGAITRTDNSNDKFELVNNTAYFKVVLDGFSVATDTKEIEQKKEKPALPTYPGYRVYNAGQWAITRIYDQNATTSLVVLVGTLEHIQTGDIYAIHQVLEGSAGNLPENFQKISTPSFGDPYSMYYNVAASAWEYGCIVGAKKGTTNTSWMYFNWNWTDNQIVSSNTSTDLLDDVVLYQLGSEDNLSSEAGNISLAYNGTTITVVSDK